MSCANVKTAGIGKEYLHEYEKKKHQYFISFRRHCVGIGLLILISEMKIFRSVNEKSPGPLTIGRETTVADSADGPPGRKALAHSRQHRRP